MNPNFPLYIVSKGRHESRLTAKALEKMGVPYYIVVEEQEYDLYMSVIKGGTVLVLDRKYLDNYDTFDKLGYKKSKGPGAARNFAWDHSISNGFSHHWVMDDNISEFLRLHNNMKLRVNDGAVFKAMEDFVLRYSNVCMAVPNYYMFAPRKAKIAPFITNTRIYSCNFIRNDIPFRWRGRYNEDTDLSLRILKSGMCTIQFNVFLQLKAPTQTIKGGNTKEFYSNEGTLAKSKMQVKMHPDVSRLKFRFGRWHHFVDYRPFKINQLRLKDDIFIPEEPNNYGLKLNDMRVNELQKRNTQSGSNKNS